MRYESLQRLCAAQFGGLKDAARKAKEAMQKKKDAEEQARKEADAKKEA